MPWECAQDNHHECLAEHIGPDLDMACQFTREVDSILSEPCLHRSLCADDKASNFLSLT